jgi:hypothetical protein
MHIHPAMGHELAQARIAELHRQADRDATARAARRARQHAVSSHQPRWAAEALGRRLQTALVAATADIRRRVLAAPAPSTKQQRPRTISARNLLRHR